MCVLCHLDGESIDHIMLECGFPKYPWERTIETFGLIVDMPRNDNIRGIIGHSGHFTPRKRTLVAAIYWNI